MWARRDSNSHGFKAHGFLRPACLPFHHSPLKYPVPLTLSLIFERPYYILTSMTIQEIYDLAVQMGVKADPRGTQGVKDFLARAKKEYDSLPDNKKKLVDLETLKSPYSDSRILYGNNKIKVKKILAGIDAQTAEILLADRLNQKGEKIDLVISHHPDGHALASLHEVMDVQIDMYADNGVPVNVAHALFEERKGVVRRSINPLNHSRTSDAARLLNVPLMVLHTIWDNMGHHFMRGYIENKNYFNVGEVLDHINEIPEFIEGTKGKAGPQIVAGSPSSRAGRVMVNFTGGTNPSKELYVELAKAGVGTLVEMHVSEDSLKEMRKSHINVIDVGHMAADSIGANLFLDELEKRGVEALPCSGLVRVRRSKGK